MAADVTIVGAGVVGLCVASELADRGVSVELYDRGERIGAAACSWWAGGMLAPWCERESAEEQVARLGEESADWWEKHTDAVTRGGTLVVAQGRDRAELQRFARRTDHFREVDEAGIAELEPSLAGRFRNGLFFPDEAHLAPRTVIQRLADRLVKKGVPIHLGTDGRDAPVGRLAIDCRGLAAKDRLADLRGVKGEMLVLRCPAVTFSRPVRLLHPRIPLYVVPRGDGVFMVGATMIESDERNRITARSMLELLGAVYALHPAFGEAEILEIGVDARPAFPDNLPRLRRRGRTLFVNGLYRHGFLLSPAVARMAADSVLDEAHVPEVMDEHCP